MPCGFVRRERGRTIKNDAGRRPAKVVQHSGDAGRPPARVIEHSSDVGRPPAGAIGHSGDAGRPPARAIGHSGDVGRPPAKVIEHSSDVGRPPAGEFLTIKPACFQRFPSLSSVFHQSMAPRVLSPTFAAKRNSKRGQSHWFASIQLRNLIRIKAPCKSSC